MQGIAAVFVFCCTATLASAQCPPQCPDLHTISVSATGTATADADLAIVRVGYRLYGPDARSVYASATDTSNAIMQALTGSGVAKAAIESSSQILQRADPYELQQFPMGSEEQRNHQFRAVQSWVIHAKPDNSAQILNTAIRAGANESGWIEWQVHNPSDLEALAADRPSPTPGCWPIRLQ